MFRIAAFAALKTNVIIAHGRGPNWTGFDPNDIHLESVSLADDRNAVSCSATVSAKGTTERVVYVIGATLGSWRLNSAGTTVWQWVGTNFFLKGPSLPHQTRRVRPSKPPSKLPRASQINHGVPAQGSFAPLARGRRRPRSRMSRGLSAFRLRANCSMGWTTHYFDPRLNRNAVTRSCTTKEDALRSACDLMRRECRVHLIDGPEDEKVHAVEIARWCKAHPSSDRRPPLRQL